VASLEFAIELLKATNQAGKYDAGNVSEQCLCAATSLTNIRDSYAQDICSNVETAMLKAWEVKNLPEIATHLSEVLKNLLMNGDENFVKISGFRLSEDTCKLSVVEADFSPLGSFQDWVSMQQAGGGGEISEETITELQNEGFDIKKRSPVQRMSGWRNYYTKWLKGNDNTMYPSIMERRFAWAKSNDLAPYWYWYDTTINTLNGVYPRQQPQGLRKLVTKLSRDYVQRINEACKSGGSGPIVIVDLGLLGKEVERRVEQFIEGNIPDLQMDLKFTYGGRYKGRILREEEIIGLINSGEITVSKSYERGGTIQLNYQVTSNRQFTGLYSRLIKQ